MINFVHLADLLNYCSFIANLCYNYSVQENGCDGFDMVMMMNLKLSCWVKNVVGKLCVLLKPYEGQTQLTNG